MTDDTTRKSLGQIVAEIAFSAPIGTLCDDVAKAVEAAVLEEITRSGHKIVPVEPTQEMCQQGQWKAKEWPKFPLRISPIYQSMLEAAPEYAP